jgi:hypothetical protein
VTTTGDSNADIDLGEFVQTNNQEGFVDLFIFVLDTVFLQLTRQLARNFLQTHLVSKDLGLNEGERSAVDLDEAFSFLLRLLAFVSSNFDVVCCRTLQ